MSSRRTKRAKQSEEAASTSSSDSHLSNGNSAPSSSSSSLRAEGIADATGERAQICTVLGAQWGDEGKGKLADVLAEKYDIMARFNGGSNAGHTIKFDGKEFDFHLLPCGLVHPHSLNVIGNGVVVHLPALFNELEPLKAANIATTGRLKISNRAHILFDFHQLVDGSQEQKRGTSSIGTTKRGIGPAYCSKTTRNGVRIGQLVNWEQFKKSYLGLARSHEQQFGVNIDTEEELGRLAEYRKQILEDDMIVDSVHLINQAIAQGKRILCEGANAAMLDLDYGTYPFVTSSSTTAGGVCTGLGIAPTKLQCTLGVMKAYTTRVGSGPFPTELTDDLCDGMLPRGAPGTDIGAHLQNVGHEYGVTTKRKRRCGWLDLVVMKYSHMVNNYSGINITKLDVLDQLSEVKIGVSYKLKGETLPMGSMPSTLEDLGNVEVEYETLEGWQTDITGVRKYADLPSQAKKYIERIEEILEVKVSWIGVGPGRDAMVMKE